MKAFELDIYRIDLSVLFGFALASLISQNPIQVQAQTFAQHSESTLSPLSLNEVDSSYFIYYRMCHEAGPLVKKGKYDNALSKYDEAFEQVDYVHVSMLEKALICAVKERNYFKAQHISRKIIRQSGSLKFFDNKHLNAFRSSSFYQTLEDSISIFKSVYYKTVNQYFIDQIDSLYYIDQRVIRDNSSVDGDYVIDEPSLPENRFELDWSNFKHLQALIEQFGFPSEKLVGREANEKVWYIIHHNVRIPDRSYYFPTLAKEVANGNFSPEHFAWALDQYLTNGLRKQPVFYVRNKNFKRLSEKEKSIVNQNRKSIGLPPW